jgi:cytochrome b561
MQSTRYDFIRRILHLIVAISGLGLLAVGMLFYFLDVEGTQKLFGADTTNMLLKYHKSFGIVVLISAIIIFRSRRRHGVPDYDPPQPLVTRLLSKLVQWVIIVGLIVMPIIGLLATASSGHPIEFFKWTLPGFLVEDKALAAKLFYWHSQVGLVLLGAVVIHLMAAYVHGRIAKDGVNSRMGLL